MTPEKWQEIEKLYQAMVDLPEERRSAALSESNADEEVCREVVSLLAHRRSDSFIDRNGLAIAAEAIARDTSRSLIGLNLGHNGRYSVKEFIGAGGVGEVYRARDSKLGRDVAIKVLSPGFGCMDVLTRFRREARVLAALNHANIVAVHDIEEHEELHCIVMELIDGEDLAQRIDRSGPLAVQEALTIAHEIAKAFEAAHEKGIIHRDLKPANVKLNRQDHVKVLDFGLAKVRTGGAVLSNIQSLVSMPGMMMGTAAYMSPEQLRGAEASRSSDLWAFGCVLYEMLTGNTPFRAKTNSDIITQILTADPDWKALPTHTPERIRVLLQRCLQKQPERRPSDMTVVRKEIADVLTGSRSMLPTKRHRLPVLWVVVAVLLGIIAVFAMVRDLRPLQTLALPQEISTPPTADAVSVAISPDGRNVIFVAESEGRQRLWLRSSSSPDARAFAGTDDARLPFWSPDNRSVAFFADGELKRIDVDSGSVLPVADAPFGMGGTWNPDGTILFAPSMASPIFRVDAEGGKPAALTKLEPQQTSHRFPQFLPDGANFLYYVTGTPEVRGAYRGDLEATASVRLAETDSQPIYVRSGHVFFMRDGKLYRQKFDMGQLAAIGLPIATGYDLAFDSVLEFAGVSASTTGPLVYRPKAAAEDKRQFVWMDRFGNAAGSPSPSGKEWRETLGDGGQVSTDRKWIAYASNETGRFEIYVQRFAAGEGPIGPKQRISTQGGIQVRWAQDGRELFYIALDRRLMAVPIRMVADNLEFLDAGAPVPLFMTPIGNPLQMFNQPQYLVSEDGRRFLMNAVVEQETAPLRIVK